jgi:hypothetical protein
LMGSLDSTADACGVAKVIAARAATAKTPDFQALFLLISFCSLSCCWPHLFWTALEDNVHPCEAVCQLFGFRCPAADALNPVLAHRHATVVEHGRHPTVGDLADLDHISGTKPHPPARDDFVASRQSSPLELPNAKPICRSLAQIRSAQIRILPNACEPTP